MTISNPTGWLKAWLLPWAVMGMESTWLYLWMQVISVWRGSSQPALLPYVLVAGTIAAGFVAASRIFRRDGSGAEQTALVVGIAILLAVVSVRIVYHGWSGLLSTSLPMTLVSYVRDIVERPSMETIAIVASGLLWWRGVRCADATLDSDEVYRLFRIGLLGTGIAVLLTTSALVARQDTVPVHSQIVPAVAFFLFGLVALSTARFAEIRTRAATTGTGGMTSSRFWLFVLAAAAVTIVVPGIIVAEIVTPGALQNLLYPLTLIWDGLSALILLVAYPFAYLAQILFSLLKLLLGERQPPETQQTGEQEPLNLEDWLTGAEHGPHPFFAVLKILIIIAIIVALVGILAKLVSHRSGKQSEDNPLSEERESVFAWDILLAQLRDAWANFRHRILGYRPAILGHRGPDVASPVVVSGQPLSVRQIYAALLRLIASLGIMRRADQTPYEYLTVIESVFPEERNELGELTEAYVRVRYGEEAVAAPELAKLQATWHRFQERVQDEAKTPKHEEG